MSTLVIKECDCDTAAAAGSQKVLKPSYSFIQELGLPAHFKSSFLNSWRQDQINGHCCQGAIGQWLMWPMINGHCCQDARPPACAIYLCLGKGHGSCHVLWKCKMMHSALISNLSDNVCSPMPINVQLRHP